MANEDLVQQLEANIASFEAAGPAFEEDVKLLKAKLAAVKGEKKAPAKTTVPAKTTAKRTTRRKKA